MHVDHKRDDNLVKTQRTSVGSSEASPPTGGPYPDREGKDNAPLSLLCLPSLSPLPCHFFATLSHHLFTAPLCCSPWAPYAAVSYQGDNSNCGIISPICYLTLSVISESQNRTRSLGTGPIYPQNLCCIQSLIRFVTVCVFLQLYSVKFHTLHGGESKRGL